MDTGSKQIEYLNAHSMYASICFLLFIVLLSCQSSDMSDAGSSVTHLSSDDNVDELEEGRKLFQLQCARCHGLEGGGGNAPSLQRKDLERAPDEQALANIISFGIPGTEMPGTWLLSENDVALVGRYVRSLGNIKKDKVSGNIKNGEILFDSKGACRTCHIINGQGSSLGPDLSRVGAARSDEFIRKYLVTPGFDKKAGQMINTSDGFIKYLVFDVVTENREKITGMRINEDAFSIQLRDAGGKIHSYKKSQLKSLTKQYQKSLMPSVQDAFSASEIDDLVAFLSSKI